MTNRYVAFLRGINVGGNKKVPMVQLKDVLEKHGFHNVKTLLNSGNIVFSLDEHNIKKLQGEIIDLLQQTFGFEIPVLLRPMDEIKKLIEANPFQGIEITPNTRLYVTFFSEKPKEIPSIKSDFVKVMRRTDREVCMAILLSPKQGTLDLMAAAEKAYGKNVTTRNWNTVVKVSQVA